MALSKNNVQLDIGLVAPNTYSKIVRLSGDKNNLDVLIKTYASKDIADADGKEVSSVLYTFTPDVSDDAPNYHKQGYEYAKTQPEFGDAIDC